MEPLFILLLVCVGLGIWAYIYNRVLPFKISKKYFDNNIYDEIKQYHLKFNECGVNHIFQKFLDGFVIFVDSSHFNAFQCLYDLECSVVMESAELNLAIKTEKSLSEPVHFRVWKTLDTHEWVITMPIKGIYHTLRKIPFSGVVDTKNLLEIGGIYNHSLYGDLMICGISDGESKEALYMATHKCAKEYLDGQFDAVIKAATVASRRFKRTLASIDQLNTVEKYESGD